MKGHESGRVYQAIRQAQMYGDFLILLVRETNNFILVDSRCRRLGIALLYEQLRNAALSDDEESAVHEWAIRVRTFATEVLSLKKASELIQDKYFEGECILFTDAIEDLEQQTTALLRMIHSYDDIVIKSKQPKRATDIGKLDEIVSDLALKRGDEIVAVAKAQMLDEFDERKAADAIIKPFVFKGER